MKKVLLTGSEGFIGGYVVKELLEQGYKVVGIDNLSKYGQVIRNHSKDSNYEFVEGFTVADAVAKAGGFTYRSNQKEVELLRRAENGWVKADANIGEIVKPGDIIYVRERLF